MAALPPIKRISKEDLREAPPWIDRLLTPLNLFFETVYAGLNRGITLEENLLCQIKTFQVKAGAAATNNTTSFPLTMKRLPQGLILLKASLVSGNYAPIAAAVYVEFTCDGVTVSITSITGLSNGSTYELKVILI